MRFPQKWWPCEIWKCSKLKVSIFPLEVFPIVTEFNKNILPLSSTGCSLEYLPGIIGDRLTHIRVFNNPRLTHYPALYEKFLRLHYDYWSENVVRYAWNKCNTLFFQLINKQLITITINISIGWRWANWKNNWQHNYAIWNSLFLFNIRIRVL